MSQTGWKKTRVGEDGGRITIRNGAHSLFQSLYSPPLHNLKLGLSFTAQWKRRPVKERKTPFLGCSDHYVLTHISDLHAITACMCCEVWSMLTSAADGSKYQSWTSLNTSQQNHDLPTGHILWKMFDRLTDFFNLTDTFLLTRTVSWEGFPWLWWFIIHTPVQWLVCQLICYWLEFYLHVNVFDFWL